MFGWAKFLSDKRSIENPSVSLSSAEALEVFLGVAVDAAGVKVTTETALGVPAFWAAVDFLSATISTLPLHLYSRDKDGNRKRVTSTRLSRILNVSPNPEMTSYQWRKTSEYNKLTCGRAYTYIQRTTGGDIVALWPLDPNAVTPKRIKGQMVYEYQSDQGPVQYKAKDIIDLPYNLRSNMVGHYSPIKTLKEPLGLAIALDRYAASFFAGGGVPPLSLQADFEDAAAVKRAYRAVVTAIKTANDKQKSILPMPPGYKLDKLGFNPTEIQMIEARKFQVQEIARFFSLSPVFLQDYSSGTYNNTEQADLALSKHTIKRHVVQLEQELNLKLFGGEGGMFVEFKMDGLLRGDFKSRSEAMAKAIQTAQMTPNEARALENRPAHKMGDELLIQGATVPLGQQPVLKAPKDDEGKQDDT